MTTIAFRDGVIACDSCWSYQGGIDTLSSKIMRLKSGALLGQAGANDARPLVALLQQVKTIRSLPSYEVLLNIRCEFEGLLVFPRGKMVKIATTFRSPENWTDDGDDLGIWEIEGDFAAIGSGAQFAIGAMEMNASARQAVRIACRRDMNTRTPVHTLQFSRGEK